MTNDSTEYFSTGQINCVGIRILAFDLLNAIFSSWVRSNCSQSQFFHIYSFETNNFLSIILFVKQIDIVESIKRMII